jgi:hypothetical protein
MLETGKSQEPSADVCDPLTIFPDARHRRSMVFHHNHCGLARIPAKRWTVRRGRKDQDAQTGWSDWGQGEKRAGGREYRSDRYPRQVREGIEKADYAVGCCIGNDNRLGGCTGEGCTGRGIGQGRLGKLAPGLLARSVVALLADIMHGDVVIQRWNLIVNLFIK